MKANDPKPLSVIMLVTVLSFLSVTALICGAAMMWDPSGASMQLPPEVLETAPFRNFFIPAIFLFTCLGVLPMIAVYGLLTKKQNDILERFNLYSSYRAGWMLSLFSGFGTLIWIAAQLFFTETYFFLQTVYTAVGLAVLVLSLLPSTMRYCETREQPETSGDSVGLRKRATA